jgi:hypothetical protein
LTFLADLRDPSPRPPDLGGIFARPLHRIAAVSGTTGIRIGRIAWATIVSEIIPILLLVIVVLIYETKGVDAQTRQAFAERVGAWLGPIAGAIATFAVGFRAVRAIDRPLLHGTLIGSSVALLDAVLTLGTGAAFIPLFAWSWTGRIVAGVAAGMLAARR